MLKSTVMILVALAVAACGPKGKAGAGANSADDADGTKGSSKSGDGAAGELEAGTSVCVNVLLGVRYPLEDALEENGLEPVADCMFADVQLEEGGEPGSFFMRYQRTGEDDWKRCESSADSRMGFIEECVSYISASPAGGEE